MKYIICASGPSMLDVKLNWLRRARAHGWKIIVVNNTWQLVPFADVLYAGDAEWWIKYGQDSLSGFAGEKWTSDAEIARTFGINHIARLQRAGLSYDSGSIHSGGNSGYQAINLAYHFGAKRIVLLGYDMNRDRGGHWHGEHENMLSAPQHHIDAWIRSFEFIADDLQRVKVNVLNATPLSALPYFNCARLEDALR